MTSNMARVPASPNSAMSPRDKVYTVEKLGELTQKYRRAGKKVVQAHGTFDLLHLGHVRHLEAARALGDILVVTVTGDRFVNKGPGRPVFAEALRAEMLAALGCIDLVGISHSPDAISAINTIRPDIYVKGKDYQDPEGDITGKIAFERAAVEAHGGKIHFTDDITYSSSELINRHFNVFEPHVREHLDELRGAGGLDEMIDLIASVRDYRVLLVGEAIIDEYEYVVPMGKPPKESIVAARFQDKESFAGGVIAAANHAAAICKEVDVITCLGTSDSHEDLIRAALRPNVHLHVVNRPGSPTTVKRRFIDPSYMRKLFEVYLMDDEPLTIDLQTQIDELIRDLAAKADVTVVTDFGHGLIAPSSIKVLTDAARFLAVNTQSNSANLGYNLVTKYPRADYVCIDAPEARLAVSDRISKISDIAHRLAESHVDCSKLIITHGRHGCVTYERDRPVHTIPAFARQVVDTVGAGDAFLAMTAPLVAAGGTMDKIGFIGNVVGALKVEIIGHRKPIEKASLIKSITGLLR